MAHRDCSEFHAGGGTFALALVLALVAAPALQAADLYPPDYAGQPHWAVAFWEDEGAGLTLTGFDFEAGVYPLSQQDLFGGGPGQPSLEIDPIPGTGALFSFFMPNFIDPLPLKLMRIQVTYADPGPEPLVTGIIASDPSGPVATMRGEHFVPGSVPLTGLSYFYEDWHLWPNPDWEIAQIFVPDGAMLEQVVVHTLSTVPLPPAVWLLGSALVGLAVVARQRAGNV